MKFSKYLKDKLVILVAYLIICGLVIILLKIFECSSELIIMVSFLLAMNLLIAVLYDYFRRRGFYNELKNNVDVLDKKYLVTEMLVKPSFYEGEILSEELYEINKSMAEQVKKFENENNDFKDFIQMWVHEVKLPISSISLMCHNNRDEFSQRIEKQVHRIDNYTEQVLYFVRSENSNEDYHIKQVMLSDVIKKTALRNKDDILEMDAVLAVENLDIVVVTDSKWIEFIINQIMSNSLKYACEDRILQINIFAEEAVTENGIKKVTLHIKDNGIGIPDKDLGRVFNKCFTGENGKDYAKSTGMGLYIVKGLCKKLGHGIKVESVEGEYTDVIITFQNCNVV